MVHQPRFPLNKNSSERNTEKNAIEILKELGKQNDNIFTIQSSIQQLIDEDFIIYNDDVDRYLGFYSCFLRELSQKENTNNVEWFIHTIETIAGLIGSVEIPEKIKQGVFKVWDKNPSYSKYDL